MARIHKHQQIMTDFKHKYLDAKRRARMAKELKCNATEILRLKGPQDKKLIH